MNETNDNWGFLGRGWGFPPEFNRSAGEVVMVSEEEDIRESLRILLGTSPGERPMNPSYGCELNSMVFENIDESSEVRIHDMVEQAILFFEPRITLDSVEVDATNIDDGVVNLRVDYTIRTTNARNNMVHPFYFLEGTNIPS